MSAAFPKRPPPVLMAGNDVRAIRPWLNGVRNSVASVADFCRSLSGAPGATAHPQDVRRAPPFAAWIATDPASGQLRAYAKGGRVDIPADGVKLTCADLPDDSGADVGYASEYAVIASVTFGAPNTVTLSVISSGWELSVGWPASPYATYGFLVAYFGADLKAFQHQAGSILWAKPAKGSIIAVAAGAAAPSGYLLADGSNGTDNLVGRTIHGLPAGGTDGATIGNATHAHNATLAGFTADGIGSGTSFYAGTSATLGTDAGTDLSFQPSMYLRYYQAI